jgi:hypothetical protein
MQRFLGKKSARLAGVSRPVGSFLAVSSVAAMMLGTTSLAPSSASASTSNVAVQSGGMVRAGSQVKSPSLPAANPSCHSVTYRGNAGYISVQESNNRLQWGITMTPLSYSIGTWSVSTYLSGKKTSSGFNRTVTTPYIPHSSLAVPSGKIFQVQAKVVGPNGTFVTIPHACVR